MDSSNVAVLRGNVSYLVVKRLRDTTGSDSDVLKFHIASCDERNCSYLFLFHI